MNIFTHTKHFKNKSCQSVKQNNNKKRAKIFFPKKKRIINFPLVTRNNIVDPKTPKPKIKNKTKQNSTHTQNPEWHLNLYIQLTIDISFLET